MTCGTCGAEMDWGDCHALCDEGACDAYEDDPINESPGAFFDCAECDGEGGWWVCGPCCDRAEQKRTPPPANTTRATRGEE